MAHNKTYHSKKKKVRKTSAVSSDLSSKKEKPEGRTAWHVYFIWLLRSKGPASFEITGEFPLGKEPQRADSLLLRRLDDRALDSTAEVLRGLWGQIDKVAILEFKSISAPFAPSDLYRLLGYAYQYLVLVQNLLPIELVLVLVVSCRNQALLTEFGTLRMNLIESPDGYHRVTGAIFPMMLIEMDVVAQEEKDALLSFFAEHRQVSREALHWWQQQTGQDMANLKDLQHYDDVEKRFLDSLPLEKRLAGLTPEQRTQGLAPDQIASVLTPEQRTQGLAVEQRLAGLDEAHTVLALPVAILRVLPHEYISSLPDDVQAEVQRRLSTS